MCTAQDMHQRLQEEGLDPLASSDERLSLLWQLYMSCENTVKSLNQQIQDLQKERVAEIEKVQQHISQIKSLTKTRDSVALGLEQENQTLHATLDDINQQQETQRSEIAEMLLQEGLADIIPISLSEQVAYLLADRASLLEKMQSREDVEEMKLMQDHEALKQKTSPSHVENVLHVAPLHIQSPWRRLLGLRKAAQSKQKLTPATEMLYSVDDKLKERTLQELERDVEEASARLAMAHKEIRRLTDELESAHLTQKAYEPELQEAQLEVEHLRHEVEKLKRCEVAELRKTKEINQKQEDELCHLRQIVKRLQTERVHLLQMGKPEHMEETHGNRGRTCKLHTELQNGRAGTQTSDLLATETSDSTVTPSKNKKPQEEEVHKRCVDEMQERLQDLTQVTLKLRMDFETETELRRRAVDECEEQKKKRMEAEQLVRNFQTLCEKQTDDYRSSIGGLQVEIRDLVSKVRELEVQDMERQCDKHLKQVSCLQDEVCRLKLVLQEEQEKSKQMLINMQMEMDQARALVQSQEIQLQKDADEQKSMIEELKSIQKILNTTKQELLMQRRNNTKLQNNISDEQQENLRLQQDLQNRITSSQQDSESLRTELQLALVSVDAERSKYNDKRIHYKNKLSRARALYLRETSRRDEQIKDLEKQICILRKQEEKMSHMMKMVMSENQSLLQNNTDLLLQLHDSEEIQKNTSHIVSTMQRRINLLEEENSRLQQTTAQMSEHIECLTTLAETDCDDEVSAGSRVIEGEDQTTLPT
ncbi:putative golgin subfamily A member 6-like protein 19 isoform X2 [Danio aesculapii]|uniref:putative golgin subfamily A member 6-like protein 19 isoform X2 n=1 Tax=Danio aesculapii TaxID=1142201 RepID=UPI0024BF2621|nr:putative golgin subfamily A member 6-like protein 19 isoform X2 [Danio aesculapii]